MVGWANYTLSTCHNLSSYFLVRLFFLCCTCSFFFFHISQHFTAFPTVESFCLSQPSDFVVIVVVVHVAKLHGTSFVPSSDTNNKKARKHRRWRRMRRRRRRRSGLAHSSFPLSVFNYLPLLPTFLFYLPDSLSSYIPTYLPTFSTYLVRSPSYLPTYLPTYLVFLPTIPPTWLPLLSS